MAKVAVDRLKEKPLYQRYYQKYLGVGIVFSLILVWSIVDLGIKPQHLWEGLPHFFRLLLEMMPPNWQILISIDIWWAVLETLSMAFVGTVFGALMSFGLALLAANNVTSCRVVREFSKGLLATERAVPTLVIILLLVVVVGLGPFAGMIAIAIGSIGMLGKLFAEAIENTDPKAPESLESVGAGGLQVIRYAVLPQVLPSLIANTLYRFDINIRVAIFFRDSRWRWYWF